jgi:SAM-dependent methyltransferase
LYARTNRGYEELVRYYYGPEILNPLVLKKKRILYAGCGDGQFVKDLRNILGITALGVDIHLNDVQKKYPQYFLEADLRETRLPALSFDLIFSTWSVLSYEGGRPESTRLVGEIIYELDRVLAPGGRILISPAPVGVGGSHYVMKLFQSLGYQVNVLNQQANKKIPSGSSVLEMIKSGRQDNAAGPYGLR